MEESLSKKITPETDGVVIENDLGNHQNEERNRLKNSMVGVNLWRI